MRRSSWMISGLWRWVRIRHMRIASSRSEQLKAWSGAGFAGSPSCMHGAWRGVDYARGHHGVHVGVEDGGNHTVGHGSALRADVGVPRSSAAPRQA